MRRFFFSYSYNYKEGSYHFGMHFVERLQDKKVDDEDLKMKRV